MEIFYEISLEIVWGFYGGNMANQIIHSQYQFYHKISIKSITFYTSVSILSP